jgi:methylmalonyl-CoA mutase C-terminal domain/subunit
MAALLKWTRTVGKTADVSGGNPMVRNRKIKIIVAKPGLDGHDRGAKLLARIFAEAGMEVVYTGLRQTPEMIAEAALQEDADVVGLSSLSGVHNYSFPRVVELLKQKGLEDVLVLGGGIIPLEDIDGLKQAGIKAIFGPGTSTSDIVRFIQENVRTLN